MAQPETTSVRDLRGLEPSDLLEMYRLMLVSRLIDEREMSLKRQSKVFFQLSAAGHEAIQVAITRHLRPGSDWIYPYYRDRPFAVAMGQTPYEHFLQGAGAAEDAASRGRQMPVHFSDPALRIVSVSSPTGSQYLQAVGSAEAAYRAKRLPDLRPWMEEFDDDEVVIVCGGTGQRRRASSGRR